jgi:hypothetical protein
MDVSISQEIINLIGQIGVGNFLLVLFSLFVVVNAPNILDKVLGRKQRNDREKQQTENMTFMKTQIKNIWDESRRTTESIDQFRNKFEVQKQQTEDYSKMSAEQNKQRIAENFAITDSINNIVNSIDSIEKMMRNVMSEQDSMGLISLKMGSVEDFKTRLVAKIMQILNSAQNGSIELDVKAVINSEWLDLKSEFDAFNMPFSMRSFLDKFDVELWEDDGMFNIVKNIAINDLTNERKQATMSKQIDSGLRAIQAQLNDYLAELRRQ